MDESTAGSLYSNEMILLYFFLYFNFMYFFLVQNPLGGDGSGDR